MQSDSCVAHNRALGNHGARASGHGDDFTADTIVYTQMLTVIACNSN